MRIDQIDLNLIVVFNALMKTKSVTKSAEMLFVSQSAISQSLKRLREIIADPLLVRSGNIMLPTPRAKKMTEPAIRIARELEQLLSPQKEFDPTNSCRAFVIRAPEYFECIVSPLLYEYCINFAPEISIRLDYLDYEINESELLNQEVDLIVGIDQFMPENKNLNYQLLPPDKLTCMVGKHHPVKTLNSPIQYISQRHVHDSLMQFMDIENWYKMSNIKAKSTFNVESYIGIVGLVEKNHCMATLPYLAAKKLAQHAEVRLISPPEDFPKFKMNMAWHPLFDADPGLRWLKMTIDRIYNELLFNLS